jgi:NADH-quinone oxidoreductase subunit J
MYVTLEAQFLAAIQVIIYAGGIVILLLFVIMLLGSEEIESDLSQLPWTAFVGLILGVMLLGALILSVLDAFTGTESSATLLEGGAPYRVGIELFTKYVLPIELVAVLLLVALIGALLMGRYPRRGIKSVGTEQQTLGSEVQQ